MKKGEERYEFFRVLALFFIHVGLCRWGLSGLESQRAEEALQIHDFGYADRSSRSAVLRGHF